MRNFLLCIAMYAVCLTCYAEPVIVNDSPISTALIRDIAASDSSQEWSETVAALTDSLLSRGFFGATAVYGPGDTLQVRAGSLCSTRFIRWFGDSTSIPPELFRLMPLAVGRDFEFRQVDASAGILLDWCDENGFPFARLDVDSIVPQDSDRVVDLFLNFRSGPQIALAFVRFEGNSITRERTLLKESRLRTGSLYRQSRVTLARRRLSQLEYLRRVGVPKLVINDSGQSGLLIPVEESRMSRLDIVAGLAPAREGEAQSVAGRADLQLLNLFGSGRRAKIFWQRPASGVQELALAWREVWIAGTPFRADLSFAQRVEDTLYVTRKYGARLGYPLSVSLEVFGGVSREELLADEATAEFLGLATHQTLFWESGIVVDTRDHLTNPRGGIRFETSVATGERKTDAPPAGSHLTSFTQRRAESDAEINAEVLPYWILHTEGHARAIVSDEPEVPLPDLYRVGGARSMRGFREEQFLGSQVAWGAFEVRNWLGPSSRVAGFGDFGAIFREKIVDGRTTSATILRAAYGVGLRLETGIGVWGIDYGIAGGTSPLNGQLHVSLLSLF
ncbi:MAG: BamA/TamA family outer membrane protein [Calditrichaeota bacterium]|nr:BamA/TamA family outer membrane protein [Calditrichota bacterium]MCB9366250.1 BamA/TamA family outer membrane protein [Calditrichota bacterium]MCB9391681.1 BamA/TamA family outer membrane protein [Calditrichota bacterium]